MSNSLWTQLGSLARLPGAEYEAAQSRTRASDAAGRLAGRMLKNDTQGAAGAQRNAAAMGVGGPLRHIKGPKKS